ncbi:hypothetical protein [Caballeronia sp. LZ043]|uniref:hypothetical protein n=1 Tax=Caballeronia sp. LZ043 TaxID=3038569 RepID=UPI00285AFA5B|nr:hypothetical protein [Caballeronia sp. LZ043]MDR5826065.1 hypothetical protein [Caballeronia sp. LZ043]
MPDSRHVIRFPLRLSPRPVEALTDPLPASEFNELEVRFALALYAKADAERVDGRSEAVPANFLGVFVDLIDILEANGRDDAHRAMVDLSRVIEALYPDEDERLYGDGGARR